MSVLVTTVACALLAAAPPSATGAVVGKIAWVGAASPMEPPLDRSMEPSCPAGLPADRPFLLSADGTGLQNVVVRLEPTTPGPLAPEPKPIRVEQRGCSYWPRVQVARKGQPLQVTNADGLLHNLHAYAGRKALFNLPETPGASLTRALPAPPEVLRLKCDIHPWMVAWVVFTDSPYAAVSDAQGAFALRGVAPGHYRLTLWHERLGTQERELDVVAGRTQQISLAFPPPPTSPASP